MYSLDDHIDTPNERLKKFRHKLGFNQAEMAELLEMQQGSYSDIERGKNQISSRAISIIAERFDVDLNWLFRGISSRQVNETSPKYRSKQILAPVPANAGIPFTYSQEWLGDPVPLSIPGYRSELVVFMIDGMSMIPTVEPGSYLGCRPIKDRLSIKEKAIYVVVASYGIWLKRLQLGEASTTLFSDNPDYPAFTVEHSDIVELYEPIVKIISFDPLQVGADIAPFFKRMYIQNTDE